MVAVDLLRNWSRWEGRITVGFAGKHHLRLRGPRSSGRLLGGSAGLRQAGGSTRIHGGVARRGEGSERRGRHRRSRWKRTAPVLREKTQGADYLEPDPPRPERLGQGGGGRTPGRSGRARGGDQDADDRPLRRDLDRDEGPGG